MKPIVYIVLLAVALLVFKAFFLDDYLAQKKAAEANVPEANVTAAAKPEEVSPKPVSGVRIKGIYGTEGNMSIEKPKPSYSEMPLEKVGDTIAEKLEDKIRVDNGK